MQSLLPAFRIGFGILCLLYFFPPGWEDTTALAAATTPKHYMAEGRRLLQRGDVEQAVRSWIEAVRLYRDTQQYDAHIEALRYLAEAYQALGQYKQAEKHLKEAQQLVAQRPDQLQRAVILASLGNIYIATKQEMVAKQHLDQALELARALDNTSLIANIQNNLGNLLISQKKPHDALRMYQEGVVFAKKVHDPAMTARLLTHAAMAAMQEKQYPDARSLLDEALHMLQGIEHTHDTVYDLINIGVTYDRLRGHVRSSPANISEAPLLLAARAFNDAARVAESVADARALSYALGYLGRLYETARRYQEALVLTRRATFVAQQVHAPESLYLWQWQTGRLLKALGDSEAAMAAYRRAIESLQSIRTELPRSYGEIQGSFREVVGPLYFEHVDLLLQRAAALQAHTQDASEELQEARETVEQFKAAELRDYFRDECVDAARSKPIPIDHLSRTAIIVYPISLPDRLELLVSLPTGLQRFTVPVGAGELERVAQSFREALQKGSQQLSRNQAKSLYDWLVRPIEKELASSSMQTVVFVPDGALRTIPLAALHDGQQFLISKYAVAVTPGIDLTNPLPLGRDNLRILAAGISVPVQGFSALPYVEGELKKLENGHGATTLLNKDFNIARVETALKKEQFGIIHIASHAQFGSDAEQSFLLTSDRKLTLDELAQLVGRLRFRTKPLELLTLSACETASGDDRAALGLAGVAIKAGASSALATLWSVEDEAASILVTAFYRHLQESSISRAVALQRAQLEMLRHPQYRDPFFWAPFLLINNWQ